MELLSSDQPYPTTVSHYLLFGYFGTIYSERGDLIAILQF